MKSRRNKGYKIKDYGRIFDSSSRRKKKKARNTILFILVLLILGFVGYSVSGPLMNLISGKKTDRPSNSSSQIVSDKAESTKNEETSSKAEIKPILENSKMAYVPFVKIKDSENLEKYFKSLKDKGFDSAILELKDEQGIVYFNTKNEIAKNVGAISSEAISDISSVVKIAKKTGLTPIAQINAFKDKIATKNHDAKILYTGNPDWSWFDGKNGKPWLNPYSSTAQGYIKDLALELCDYGFENIMVSSIMFPSVRRYVGADFGPLEQSVTHRDILAQFTSSLKAEINKKNAKLIIDFDYSQALKEDNSIYGGGNPLSFSADGYAVLLAYDKENPSALAESIDKIKEQKPKGPFAVKIAMGTDEEKLTKEELDKQLSVCKDCSVYIYDKSGNYVG